jgi:hypothetical protein
MMTKYAASPIADELAQSTPTRSGEDAPETSRTRTSPRTARTTPPTVARCGARPVRNQSQSTTRTMPRYSMSRAMLTCRWVTALK